MSDLKSKIRFLSNLNVLTIHGLNGSGKTSLLKQIISTTNNKNINNYIYYLMLLDKYNYIHELLHELQPLDINSFLETSKQLGILFNLNNYLKINHLSTGQKKKIYLSILLSKKEVNWFIDEPNNYLDRLSYQLFKNKLKQHITIGGNIVLTTNTPIYIKKNKYISLSRFELLTTRLSSECSTTEL